MPPPFLRLFGQPQLLSPTGACLALRTAKQVALLVYLAIEARDRAVSRDRLSELLWFGCAAERGRHSLSQGLTAIREHLGKDALTRNRDSVQLVTPLTTEIDALRNGSVAEIKEVEPLQGLEHVGSPEFAHWVERSREHLLANIRRILSDQINAARSEGNVTAVHERAEQLYRVDPTSDIAVYALAERALLNRDQRSAIRILRTHARTTRDTLGISPPEDLKTLLARIEQGAVRVPAPDPDLAGRAMRPEIFLGREAEIASLEALWAETRAGSLKSCVLVGAPGIGKSSLAHRFATSVTARAYPAWEVSCQEIGGNVPYAATSDLIRLLLRDRDVGGTDLHWLSEASRVVPEVRLRYSAVPHPPDIPADSVRIRMSEALFRMLTAIAEGDPCLLVIDNWQHIDPVSRDVFYLLVRRLAETPTLLVATYATDQGAQPDSAADFRLSGMDWSAQLEVGPLPDTQARQMVLQLVGDDGEVRASSAARAIARLSQGNPYLIEMLVSDWRTNGAESLVEQEGHGVLGGAALWRPPSPMRAAFARQYRGLSPDAQQLVRLLAVAGRTLTGDELARVVSLDARQIERAVLELIDRALLRVEDGAFGFRNRVHRAFVYHEMAEDARRYHHGRLAEFLESPAGPDSPRALEACHHFLKAGQARHACDVVLRAADVAVSHGAPREAARAVRAALVEADADVRSRLWLLLSRALAAEGKYREALDALGNWSDRAPHPSERVQAALTRAESIHRGRLADDSTIRSLVVEAERAARDHGSLADRVRALQLEAEVAAESGHLDELEATHERALAVLAESDGEPKALAQLTAGYVLLMLGKAEEALQSFRSASGVLRTLRLDPEVRKTLTGIGAAQWHLGDLRSAVASHEDAARLANTIGDENATASCWSNLGVVYSDKGEADAARECYRRALDSNRAAPSNRRTAEIYYNITALRMIEGDLDGAREAADRSTAAAAESQFWRLMRDAAIAQADVAVALGTPEAAWPRVDEAIAYSSGREDLFLSGHFERLRLQRLVAAGNVEQVRIAIQRVRHAQQRMPLRDRLELAVTEVWLDAQLKGLLPKYTDPRALTRLKELGLVGCLRILQLTGIVGSQ